MSLCEKLTKSQSFQLLLSIQEKLIDLSDENITEVQTLIQSYLSIRKTKSSLLLIFTLISCINECRIKNIDLSFVILANYFTEMKEFFTNEQILQIFPNKNYQLFLMDNKIINIKDISNYYHNNQQIVSLFETKNKTENQLNSIIKENDVSQFQEFISKSNTSLQSRISLSFTDSMKLNNNSSKPPTLLEYSVAHSSVKIVKFILMNENEIESQELYKDIGRYAIYSGNPEIIHLLEQYHLISKISSQKMFFLLDSISFHRNSIVDYIIENYEAKFIFDYFSNCLHSCNFYCFCHYLIDSSVFADINQLNVYKQSLLIFATQFGVFEIVEVLLSFDNLDVNSQDIYKVFY